MPKRGRMWPVLVGALELTTSGPQRSHRQLTDAPLLALPTLGIVPVLWKSSWEQWRCGSTDRPDAAIAIGVMTAALLATAVVVALVVTPFTG